MQKLDKRQTLGRFSPGISYLYLIKNLCLAGIVFALLVPAFFIGLSFVSAKAAAVDTSTFCTQVTYYGSPDGKPHCQTGDKTVLGWLDKTIPKQVPPIAGLKVLNLGGNPAAKGKLTIYTPQLYCAGHWADLTGPGFVEVNGQRFATCKSSVNNLGPGGFNYGAEYLFYRASMVRIITNIKLSYGQTIVIRIFGGIYAEIRDKCPLEQNHKCVYPGISPGWVYEYTKTGTHANKLANFYRANKTSGAKHIYDFLTIKYADFDFDNKVSDYYDFDDLLMTFAFTGK
jgi:hypothetical protein